MYVIQMMYENIESYTCLNLWKLAVILSRSKQNSCPQELILLEIECERDISRNLKEGLTSNEDSYGRRFLLHRYRDTNAVPTSLMVDYLVLHHAS